MKKKIVVTMMTMGMVIGFMTGCGSKNETSSTSEEKKVESQSMTNGNEDTGDVTEEATEELGESSENPVISNEDDLQNTLTWAKAHHIVFENAHKQNGEKFFSFITAKMTDAGTTYDGQLDLNCHATGDVVINEDGTKTITFTASFLRPATGYSFLGEVVDGYTGLVYDFKAVVGSTKQRAEQSIEVDGKSYAVSITVDFVDARRTDEYCTLTYVVDCPVDYNGALFYVGGDIKEAGTEKEFNNETEISQTEEQSWFQEGHLEEDASGNQVYVMNGKWFTVFIEE